MWLNFLLTFLKESMHTEIFYRLLCGDSVLTDENTMEITSAGMTFKEAFFMQSILMK